MKEIKNAKLIFENGEELQVKHFTPVSGVKGFIRFFLNERLNTYVKNGVPKKLVLTIEKNNYDELEKDFNDTYNEGACGYIPPYEYFKNNKNFKSEIFIKEVNL